jgi:hypothetical protein
MGDTSRARARTRLAAHANGSTGEGAPAHGLAQDPTPIGGPATAGTEQRRGAGSGFVSDVPVEDVSARLGLFEGVRTELDMMEAQVGVGAGQHGMDGKQVAARPGPRSRLAASWRHQRQVPWLEEIRQGVR